MYSTWVCIDQSCYGGYNIITVIILLKLRLYELYFVPDIVLKAWLLYDLRQCSQHPLFTRGSVLILQILKAHK